MDRQRTWEVVDAWLSDHDPRWLSEDAVFEDTGTGTTVAGRARIAEMLDSVYRVGLEARPVITNLVVSEGKAAMEAVVVGRHVGEFAGIEATGADVRVPLAVVYDVAGGLITHASVYLQLERFREQVMSTASAKVRL